MVLPQLGVSVQPLGLCVTQVEIRTIHTHVGRVLTVGASKRVHMAKARRTGAARSQYASIQKTRVQQSAQTRCISAQRAQASRAQAVEAAIASASSVASSSAEAFIILAEKASTSRPPTIL